MTGQRELAGRVHLHADDYPVALALLAEIQLARRHDPVALAEIGYEPTEHGVWVDWDQLAHSWLSSTERAALLVARGVAAAERHGGWPPRLGRALTRAVGSL
jgi:hypothetical protein